MFITMDVVFHEDTIYFSSEPELQGEYHKEIQTLDYDFIDCELQISEKDEVPESRNQDVGNLDSSGDDSQTRQTNQELEDQNGDEHLEIEDVTETKDVEKNSIADQD